MAKQTPSRLLSLYDFFAPKKPRYDDDESVTYEEEAVEQTAVSETDSPSLLCDSDSDNDELNESKTAAVSQPVFMMEESAPSSFSLIPVSTTLPNDIAVTSKSSPVQPTGVRFPDTSFSGFRDWKHATGKSGALTKHEYSKSHKQSVLSWEQSVLNLVQNKTLPERFSSQRSEVVRKNRHYLKSVIEVLLLCCHQEIAIRGHDESCDSTNRGNFKEILALLGKHDSIVEDRLSSGPRNAQYTSPEVQNILIDIMGSMVQDQVSASVKNAVFYSIIADETKDVSKSEQLSIVLRYVDKIKGSIQERFLTYVHASSFDAKHLSTYIIDTLRKHGIDPQCIVSQGYDGASVMSGKNSGVQKLIKQVAPQAQYVHCYAHCLNLVLVDCCKIVTEAANFFTLLEALYVFISSAKAHEIYVKTQSELYPTKQVRQLVRLSDTRWTSRHSSIDAVCYTFDSILQTLEKLKDDKDKCIQAGGLLCQIKSFKFVVQLVTFSRILGITNRLSEQLQCKDLDLAAAANLVSATMSTLNSLRSDKEWSHLYSYICDVAKLYCISSGNSRPTRTRNLPQYLRNGEEIPLENIQTSSIPDFKTSLY